MRTLWKKSLEFRPNKEDKRKQKLNSRRLSLENLEERCLLAVTCGPENIGIEMSAVYQAEEIPEDITPAILLGDTPIQKKDVFQGTSVETLLPCAKTIYVSSYYAAGATITSANLNTLINKAGSGGSVIFDENLTVDFTTGYIEIYSNITLAADDGCSVTFDAKGAQAFFLNWTDVTFQITGITLTGGNGSYTGSVSGGQTITSGGAIYNMGTLKLTDCLLSNSASSSDGGGIYSYGGAVYLTDSIIENCQAGQDGGGMVGVGGNFYLTDSQIRGCSSSRYGGGIGVYQNNVYAISSVLVGNNGAYGGAIGNMNTGADIYLLNSTMTGNTATKSGGGIFSYGGKVGVYNSIAVLNYASGAAADIFNYQGGGSTGTLVVDYSTFTLVKNAKGSYAGTNRITVANVATDIFVTAPAFGNGTSSAMTNLAAVDLSLQNSCEALIDTGTNLTSIYSSLGLKAPTTDAAGNARIAGEAIDIGAYENPQTRQRLGSPTLSVTRVLYRQINLAWTETAHAASYDVYYRVSGASAYSLYKNTAAMELAVTSLAGNTSYDFYIVAKPSASETEYAESLPSEVLTQATSSTKDTPWTPETANYTVSVVGAELIVTWKDSGAETIYLQYYFANNEVDVYKSQTSIGAYTSSVRTFEVQNDADHTWSVTLIYGSKVFLKMWDSTMAETDVSYTSHNISLANVNREIDVNGETVDVFNLASKPESSKTIYLDFNGHITVKSSWNTSYNKDEIISPVFSIDQSTLFSQAELEAIYQIWLNVSEDYAFFDVNVTTIFPGFDALYRADSSDTVYGIRAAIGGNATLLDDAGGMGGIAYLNSFGTTWNSSKTIFVFPNNLSQKTKSIAESTSHETGHSLGLHHRSGGSYWSGEYSYGIVSSGGQFYKGDEYEYDWAPIMGASYYSDLTQWSDGSYYNAVSYSQTDDITTMSTYLTVRDDDYSAVLKNGILSSGTYGVLTLGTDKQIDASACETGIGDDGVGFTYSGIIETRTDQDVFAIDVTSTLESITLTVKGTSYLETNYSNLPLNVYLYAKGQASPLASWEKIYQTNMSIDGVTLDYSGTIAKGTTLYLVVDGAAVLLNDGNYSSDYGSLGYYEISGSYVKKQIEPGPSAVHTLSASMDQTLYEAGDILTLQVYDAVSDPTTTFGLSVSYDTSLLEFVSASSSVYSADAVSGVFPGTKASQGTITAAWQNVAGWTAPDAETPLLTLVFTVKKVTSPAQGSFQFSALDGYLRSDDVFNPPADPVVFTVTDKITLKGITLSNTEPVVRNLLYASLTQPTAKATYQWYRVKDGQESKIAGAVSSRYKVTEADKGYALKVVATGTKGYAGTVSAMTEEIPLSAPTFAAAKLNGTDIKVVWRSVAGANTYALCYSPNADFTESETVTVSGTSAYLEDLTLGAAYYFKVQAIDSTGNLASSALSEVKSYTLNKLGTPVINSLYVNGDSMTINWNGQEGANRYVIAYSTDNFETYKTKILNLTGTEEFSYALTSLTMGATYSIRIQARDTSATKYQTSEYAYWKDIKLNRLADPAIDSLSASGTSVTLTFNAVPYANRYMIYYSSDNFATQKYKIFDTVQTGILTYTLSGLTAGNTYSFKIQARDKSAAYASSRDSEIKSVTLAAALAAADEDDFFDFAELAAETAALPDADLGIDFGDLWD